MIRGPVRMSAGGALTCGVVLATAVVAMVLRRRRVQRLAERARAPILCFGDSLTEGYLGVWHSPCAPQSPPNADRDELVHVRFRPYAVRLGARLAVQADPAALIHVGLGLRYAETRAYSGWTAAELLPRLEAALRGGPWRAAVILAGTNDIVMEGANAEVAARRVRALWHACDRQGVTVVAVAPPDCATEYHGVVPPTDKGRRRDELAGLNKLIHEMARAECRALVDARTVIPSQLPADKPGHKEAARFWDDSTHFSVLGSDTLADAIFEALQPVLQRA